MVEILLIVLEYRKQDDEDKNDDVMDGALPCTKQQQEQEDRWGRGASSGTGIA